MVGLGHSQVSLRLAFSERKASQLGGNLRHLPLCRTQRSFQVHRSRQADFRRRQYRFGSRCLGSAQVDLRLGRLENQAGIVLDHHSDCLPGCHFVVFPHHHFFDHTRFEGRHADRCRTRLDPSASLEHRLTRPG